MHKENYMEKDLLEKAKLNSLVERINVVKEDLNYYLLEDICLFSYDRESMRGLELSLVKESGGDILNIPNINGFKLTSRTGCFDILIIFTKVVFELYYFYIFSRNQFRLGRIQFYSRINKRIYYTCKCS